MKPDSRASQLMECKNNNALFFLLAVINSLCVRYRPSYLTHNIFITSYDPIKYSCPCVTYEKFDAKRISFAQ